MSRELLKRALQRLYLDNTHPPQSVADLCKEIETELNKPEPEPSGWLYDYKSIGGMRKNEFTEHEYVIEQSHALNIRPLYTIPPDQTERVGVLIAEKVVLEQQLAAKDARIVELEMEWRMKVSKIIHLEQQLAEITH